MFLISFLKSSFCKLLILIIRPIHSLNSLNSFWSCFDNASCNGLNLFFLIYGSSLTSFISLANIFLKIILLNSFNYNIDLYKFELSSGLILQGKTPVNIRINLSWTFKNCSLEIDIICRNLFCSSHKTVLGNLDKKKLIKIDKEYFIYLLTD